MLGHLSPDVDLPSKPVTVPVSGRVQVMGDDSAGGFAQLQIDPLGPEIPFTLRLTGPEAAPTGFQFDIEPASGLLKLPSACVPAAVKTDSQGKRALTAIPGGGRVVLTLNGADPLAIRVEGSIDSPARQGIVALDAADQGVLTVGTAPDAFLLGGQGFGIRLSGGLTVDSSETHAPVPAPAHTTAPAHVTAPGWKGVAIRDAELFLPETTPLIGAGPIPVDFYLGTPNGLYGRTEVSVPASQSRPAFDATVIWDDPGAVSLGSALPTSIEVRTTWNPTTVDGPKKVGAIEVLGGRPLRVTGRFARKPGTGDFDFGLVVEAGGDEGLLAVKGEGLAGKVVVTAAALATAFIADADPPTPDQTEYDGFGATLHMLLVAASGISAFLEDGQAVVHAVELDAGLGSAGTKLTLRVDYSVDVQITKIDFGFGHIGMADGVPMRLRYRNVRLLVDFSQSGMDRFHLSFGEADVEVEDPGGWQVHSPTSVPDLFDVLGSRSGHGSQWFEIDLRFALDLGPVKVSGATIRVTLDVDGGALNPELRGLDASIDMPGLVEGRGKASLGESGLDLALAAEIVPLNVGARASLSYKDCPDGPRKLVFSLAADLPGAIPLANSGLGLYGLGGIFGVNAALPFPEPGKDPVKAQLDLDPFDTARYECADGSVFGLGIAIGTLPDLGFTFSAKGVAVIALPDIAVRASLQGRVLADRVKMTEKLESSEAGGSFLGALTVSDSGVMIAARAGYTVPVLFTFEAPFAASFPSVGEDWYVRLGSDGQPGRGPGPIRATVLPDLLGIEAWAFMMAEGNGITALGGKPELSTGRGFALGFGAGFSNQFGVPPIYAKVSARALMPLGTNPLTLGGNGDLCGRLHLGPVSIGVGAVIDFLVAESLGEKWARFEVSGEVDLFFFSLKGSVTIEIGEKPEKETIPDPTEWPLKSVALSDHSYTKLGDAVLAPSRPPLADLSAVWPDAIALLQFASGPANGLASGPFAARLAWAEAVIGDGVVGNDRLSYTYTLDSLDLIEVDPKTGAETPLGGPFDASWQVPREGRHSVHGAQELALLNWHPAMWTRRLTDGAAGSPHDPVPELTNRCNAQYTAEAGWALGGAGRRAPGGPWVLPPEPASSAFTSSFTVEVAAEWWGMPFDERTAGFLPYMFPVRFGAPVAFSEPLSGFGRAFAGAFALPHMTGLARDTDWKRFKLQAAGHAMTDEPSSEPIWVLLTFSEPLFEPSLALRLPSVMEGLAQQVLAAYVVGEESTVPFPFTGERPAAGDSVIWQYEMSGGGPFTAVIVGYVAAVAVDVLGVRGVTATALAAAENATKAAAQQGEQFTEKTTYTARPMLTPGRVYRIDVGMSALGQREGKKSDKPATRKDSYWFRTVDMPRPAPSGGKQYLQNTDHDTALTQYSLYTAAPSVFQVKDTFDPVYLERYVLSWCPADQSGHWFLDDAVGVHLLVDHVVDLAHVYRHGTVVRVRRIDPTKGNPDPFEVQEFPAITCKAIVSNLQPRADLRISAEASMPGACPFPRPGGNLGGRPRLRPRCDYELSLDFPMFDGKGGLLEDGPRIRGGVFGTSRYANPGALLGDLGFVPTGSPGGGTAGGLPVDRIPVTAGDSVSDGAVEAALSRLGLGRLGTARNARTVALWTDAGGPWALHGVLLEAPEPVHRPDTLGIENFAGRMRLTGLSCGGVTFETVLRSTSGDRLLFLTGAPFVPAAPLTLAVTLQDIPLETVTVPVDGVLRCPVGPVPAFAEEMP
ncbi:hypothetical protein GCM10022221_39410 [Actinocorallia aurea]